LYAKPTGSIWTIKTLKGPHTCLGPNGLGNLRATGDFIAKSIVEMVRYQPDYKPSNIVKDVLHKHGVKVTYSKAWRAKEMVMEMVNGSHVGSYDGLLGYLECLLETNPGSFFLLHRTHDDKFRRLFLCYNASAEGWKHCKPLFGLDGSYLKSKYKVITSALLSSR
jgi:hypothetical protein